MKFSVIVPTHNGADRIERGLKSIKDQTFTDYELIVVCDSCTDNTADIARKYGAKVIEVNYCRDGLTRNAGIEAAQGEWLLFMDDDDWWLHEYAFQMIASRVGAENEDILMFSFIWKHKGYTANNEKQQWWQSGTKHGEGSSLVTLALEITLIPAICSSTGR